MGSTVGLIAPYVKWPLKDMRVPSLARRSVVFIGTCGSDAVFRPKATAFLVLTDQEPGTHWRFPYLVTAQHVVSGILLQNQEIYCRMNTKDGAFRVQKLSTENWWYHPSDDHTDVAVIQFALDMGVIDHDYIPLHKPDHYFYRDGETFGLGDEIFMIGLFRNHHGLQQNVPIVRIGNIAAMPGEPIKTEYCGLMEAYLIEVRSIAGLSGSPVFVNVQPLTVDNDDRPSAQSEMWFSPAYTNLYSGLGALARLPKNPEDLNWGKYRFLGLVHGHFDSKNLTEDSVVEDAMTAGNLNTGIGVVVPAGKILETLYQSGLVEDRKKTSDLLMKNEGATPD